MLLGRYRILHELGRGGFGAVYSAWDTNLNHKCAVKENLEPSPEAQRQFSREATILANLSHPNLPRVTDHFSIPGQGQYLVMDFVEGEDLLTLINQHGSQPVKESGEWIVQVADALTYLHSENPPVIHRDIKPANIRITPAGRAMLVDFGLVKVFNPNFKTTMGARAVTPGYAPPEQYGQGKTDARSDIYALGSTLYKLLTGLDPLESVLRSIGKRMKSVREVSPHVPEQIQSVIDRAMALDPAARYQTAQEFKSDLQNSLNLISGIFHEGRILEQAVQVSFPSERPVVQPTIQMSEQAPPQRASLAQSVSQLTPKRKMKSPWIWVGIAGIFLAGVLGLMAIGGYYLFFNTDPTRTPTAAVSSKSKYPSSTPGKFQYQETPTDVLRVPIVHSKNPGLYLHLASFEPDTLDPALDYETTGQGVIWNVYDSLIFFDKTDPNRFVPQIATIIPSLDNGGISQDGMTYRFKIRRGVKFHDGSLLSPEDVAFTFQRGILQGGSGSPQWLFTEPLLGSGIYDVAELIDPELVDDPDSLLRNNPEELQHVCQRVKDAVWVENDEVVFRLAQPWSPFLATIATAYGSILSKDWVSKNGGWNGDCSIWQRYYGRSINDLNTTNLGKSAMGTGPYRLDHWEFGKEILLRANENYWRIEPAWEGAPSGPAQIIEVAILLIDDFETRLAQLETGEADSIDVDSSQNWPRMDKLVGVECSLVDTDCKLGSNPDGPLSVIRGVPSASRTDIMYVWRINVSGGNSNIGSGKLDGEGIPPDFFANNNVRRGFAYCFNYDRYLKEYITGEAVRTINVMPPGMIGYQPDSPYYSYDPKRCEDELRKAEIDNRSLWETGFRMLIPFPSGRVGDQLIAEIFRDELLSLNQKFIIEPREIDPQDYVDQLTNTRLPLFTASWLEDIHDPHNWLYPYSVGYYARYQNLPDSIRGEMEDIVERGVVAIDPLQREEINESFNHLYYEQAPGILLFTPLNRHYQQRWVKGWYDNPIFPGIYYYVIRKE